MDSNEKNYGGCTRSITRPDEDNNITYYLLCYSMKEKNTNSYPLSQSYPRLIIWLIHPLYS